MKAGWKKYNIFLWCLAVPFSFLSRYLFDFALPFKYDWVWPLINTIELWNRLFGDSSFSLLGMLSQNASVLFGVIGLLGLSPEIFFKVFIIAIHACAGYGFYRFIFNRTKSYPIAMIAGIAYAFTPYIFIRTIVGFIWSLFAYAVLPFFLDYYFNSNSKNKIKRFLILGILMSLIFAQVQAGLLVGLILFVNLAITLFNKNFPIRVKSIAYVFLGFLLVNMPWIILALRQKRNLEMTSGGSATTLSFIANLPHSFRNIFMLSDHHITYFFFYSLAHEKLYLAGWLLVWFVAFCAIFNKKNRELVLTFLISSLIVLPFAKGPVGIFGAFYAWFFNHFPQIAVFREVYHFEFLYAISLCVLFAFGLDWLWNRISNLKLSVVSCQLSTPIRTGLRTLFAGSAIFIIAPYLTFDYAGYLKLQKIPSEYSELDQFFKEDKNYCKKIYYPPGLGFVYFKNDKTPGASNSDVLAQSLGVKYLTDGASVLVLPSEEMFYRNELVSEFYEKGDNGEFASLMQEGDVDCVVLRLDTETKYSGASNLWREKDPAVVKKWNNTDLKVLTESKVGLKLEKQFGENVLIYKEDPTTKIRIGRNYEITGKPAIQSPPRRDPVQNAGQFSNLPAGRQGSAISQLQLTDWATNSAYYKDGWSRGRYDFWRKHLFTQLRQDFIYTDKAGSILSGKIEEKGNYEVWARYLTGGKPGEIELRIMNYELSIQKDLGDEKFIWKNIGSINLNGKTDIEIKNISGENAIADLVLVKK